MKKSIIFAAIALGAALVSCQKSANPVAKIADGEIVFTFGEQSKATAVTSSTLTEFNVLCTKGDDESAQVFNEAFENNGSGTYRSKNSRVWPSTDEKYHFFASNKTITYAAGANTVSTTGNGEDVICACMTNPSYKSANSLPFQHIYAQVGTITFDTQAGFDLSGVKVSMTTPKIGGTFDLNKMKWTAYTKAGSDKELSVNASSNAYYFVSECNTNETATKNRLNITYTLSKGEWTKTFDKTSDIEFPNGKITNITFKATGGEVSDIEFSVSLEDWQDNNITGSFN